MIYLKIAHSEDNDADYFTFPDLFSVLLYIHRESIEEFVISDIMFEEVSANDYTPVSISIMENK